MVENKRGLERGFTLVELLVVILILAILAAIAIPVYFSQREKAFEGQMQSALKNAATAIETYITDNDAEYSDLDGDDISVLEPQGFVKPDWSDENPAYFRIEADQNAYCIEARHERLTESSAWRRSTYSSDEGRPILIPDNCPNL